MSKIPCSHEIKFNHGPKMVSALTLDPAGARLVTGAIDFDVKFWDFAGMDASLRSFRSTKPCERYHCNWFVCKDHYYIPVSWESILGKLWESNCDDDRNENTVIDNAIYMMTTIFIKILVKEFHEIMCDFLMLSLT